MKIKLIFKFITNTLDESELNMGQEKRYENKIKNLLKENGAYVVKQFGCGFTASGTPDLLCCLNGRFIAIEVKAENGKPSPLQIHNIKKIRESGGIALIAYPKDFDALSALITAVKDGKTITESYKHFQNL